MNLFFVSGLPRSGSTLLMNLMGQNPTHHVTPTNDLIELAVGIRNQWMTCEGFKSQGLKIVESRVRFALRGLIHGFYAEEFDASKTVFDKSRGWLACIELLEEILERPVKIIVTVRDIRDIVASFEKLFRKSSLTKHGPGAALFDVQTVDGRARQLLSKDAVLGLSVNRLLDVFDRGLGDRIVVVPYRELTSQPQQTLFRLHTALGLPSFAYDPANVEQTTHEDDAGYGIDLHTIRRVVEAETKPAWKGIVPPGVGDWLDREYSDIQILANRRYNDGFTDILADAVGIRGREGLCEDSGDADRSGGEEGSLPSGLLGG